MRVITILLIICIPVIGITCGLFYAALQVMPPVDNSFAIVTPTGNAIYSASELWMHRQILSENLIRKSTCALNASKVLALADNSLATKYGSGWAPRIGRNIRDNGGRMIKLGRTKQEIVANLRGIYGGNLPVGTIITACYSESCGPTLEHPTGSRHVAIVGETKDGTIYLHHNNYYRPVDGEGWKPGMVSKKYLAQGIERQWQRSPWIALKTDTVGKLDDFKVVAPPMLRILNPYNAFVWVSVPPEIASEINQGHAYQVSKDGYYHQVGRQSTYDMISNPIWTVKPYVHNALADLNKLNNQEQHLSAK